jgi:alpha-tubulin suppressor-like RCC1 family protein
MRCGNYVRSAFGRTLPVWLTCIVACGGDGPTQVQPAVAGRNGLAASIAVVSGADAKWAADDTVAKPVRLIVLDSAGAPRIGDQVVVKGPSRSAAALSDTSGIATISLRAEPKPGSYAYTAEVSGGTPSHPMVLSVSFTETTVAGAPAAIAVVGPPVLLDRFPGQVVTPPGFTVQDRIQNPVSGIAVRFAVTVGGSVSDTTLITDSLGHVAPRTWTLGPSAGAQLLTATAGDITASSVAEATNPPPAKIQVWFGDKQLLAVRSATQSIAVAVTDHAGQPMDGAQVIFRDQRTGQTVCTTQTGPGGDAWLYPSETPACGWVIMQPGVNLLTVTSDTVSATVTATGVPRPSALRLVGDSARGLSYAPSTTIRNAIVVQLLDANGAPAAGYLLDLTALPYRGTVTDTVTTDARGVGRFSWQLGPSLGPETLTVTVHLVPDLRESVTAFVAGRPQFQTISAGDAHTCGSTLRQTTPPVICWGRNSLGQLGDGTIIGRTTPVVAVVSTSDDKPLTWASAGSGFTCATLDVTYLSYLSTTYPRHLYCWGADASGQTGVPPVQSAQPFDQGQGLDSPSAGASHACAVHADLYVQNDPHHSEASQADTIVCWGDNRFGQLGDGTTVGRSTRAPIAARIVGMVAAGDGFTCAMTGDGRAFCWGHNADGQLGDGTTIDRLVPVPVAAPTTFIIRWQLSFGVTPNIAVGSAHACAIGSDGVAYCWGRNDSGQLGDGTTDSRSSPTPVSGNLRFVWLAAGGSHTCGLTTTGVAYCWGANLSGQLGTGAASSASLVPSRVVSAPAFWVITAGKSHTCALTVADHTAYCWGLNADGQLGDGTTIDRATPVPVAQLQGPGAAAALGRKR